MKRFLILDGYGGVRVGEGVVWSNGTWSGWLFGERSDDIWTQPLDEKEFAQWITDRCELAMFAFVDLESA